MKKKQMKRITSMAIVVLFLSIIPMLWIGQYLHPFADDYVFGAEVYKIWSETHSFTACIQGAWDVATTMYHTWQGTYSACFLMALQPGVFGQYWLGPFILLFGLMGSTYLLLYVILRKLLHATKVECLFVSTLFTLMTVQFTWSYYDAFYWYNGAMYYTLFYSMSLILASLMIGYQVTNSRAKKIAIACFSIVLAIIIAGGNFVSGLGMAAILFTTIILMRVEQKRFSRFFISILLVYGIAFSFSVLAPGNAFRQITVTNQPNIMEAFLMTFGKSLEFLSDSFNIVEFLLLLVLAPLVIQLASKSRFKFSHPWLCILITFVLYSSFFFAHSYAMGTRGPGRVQNVYSYVHLWFLCINLYYLSGALLRKAAGQAPLSSAIVELVGVIKQKYATTLSYTTAFACVVLLLSVSIKNTTTNRTISLFLKGTVSKFDHEMTERENVIKSNPAKVLTLKPLTVKMPSDAFNDITIYPGYWINQGMAKYYDKERIIALPNTQATESPSMLLARCKRDVGPGNLKFISYK